VIIAHRLPRAGRCGGRDPALPVDRLSSMMRAIVAPPAPADPRAGGGLTRLSPSLFWYRDTCNVYLVKRGDRGLLIDFGSGGVLAHLAEAGVREVEWVFHTHHHRDQCQGDGLLAERGIPIAVPEREAALFAEADAFWRLKRIYDNYDVSSIGNTLARPVPI